MATQSKFNPLFIIIIIAVLLFISALIWKTTHIDNSEPITLSKTTSSKPKTIAKPKIQQNTYVETSFEDEALTKVYSENEKIQYKKRVSNSFRNHYYYKTPEKIMETILYYQDIGDEIKANEFIALLIEKFPDYKIED